MQGLLERVWGKEPGFEGSRGAGLGTRWQSEAAPGQGVGSWGWHNRLARSRAWQGRSSFPVQMRPEGPSGEAADGRDPSCSSLAAAAALSDAILPASAPRRTQPQSDPPASHPSPLTERMRSPSPRISGHDVHTSRCAAGEERGWGLLF